MHCSCKVRRIEFWKTLKTESNNQKKSTLKIVKHICASSSMHLLGLEASQPLLNTMCLPILFWVRRVKSKKM